MRKLLPMLAIFILPPEWDDVKFSVRSPTVERIYEDTLVRSVNQYTFTVADRTITTRLKCKQIPKIPCSTGRINVYGAITGTYLVKVNPDGSYSMPNLKRIQLVAEDLGNSFNVCPVIITDDWGTFFMEYNYYESQDGNKFSRSYADVEVWQVCR